MPSARRCVPQQRAHEAAEFLRILPINKFFNSCSGRFDGLNYLKHAQI